MKRQSLFVASVIVGAFVVSLLIYFFIFGADSNFKNPAKHEDPVNLLGTIYTGGALVPVLITLTIMIFTFIFERTFSLAKAQGKKNIAAFLHQIQHHLNNGDVEGAIKACNEQRGSCANIIRSGLERYQQLRTSSAMDADKKMAEVKRAIEEATMLETPLLEKNLIALSTIASISTMVGLLGTVIGMIRSFRALADTGTAASASQLSVGISEALVNTAGGIFAAIAAIIAYNYFTNKVDGFVYMIDEATFDVVETLGTRGK